MTLSNCSRTDPRLLELLVAAIFPKCSGIWVTIERECMRGDKTLHVLPLVAQSRRESTQAHFAISAACVNANTVSA